MGRKPRKGKEKKKNFSKSKLGRKARKGKERKVKKKKFFLSLNWVGNQVKERKGKKKKICQV